MEVMINRQAVDEALRAAGRSWGDVVQRYTAAGVPHDACWAVEFETTAQLAEFLVALAGANSRGTGDRPWDPIRQIQNMASATYTSREGLERDEVLAYWPGYRLDDEGIPSADDLRLMLRRLCVAVEEGRVGSEAATLWEFARLFRAFDADRCADAAYGKVFPFSSVPSARREPLGEPESPQR